MTIAKSVYFASDFHLGIPYKSKEREKLIIAWLESIKATASHLYLVGDLFDFWHDYNYVVPKGFVSFLAKVKELVDFGVEVHVFTGNHDLWMYGYFEEELGVIIHRGPFTAMHGNKNLYIAHGDGLGPGDRGYKFLKKIFTNKLCQFLFKWLHPDLGIPLAYFFSKKSRAVESNDNQHFLGEDKEWLIIHSKEILKTQHFDFFIYGHRHLAVKYRLINSIYINLGDWISNFTFGELQNDKFELRRFDKSGSATIDFISK